MKVWSYIHSFNVRLCVFHCVSFTQTSPLDTATVQSSSPKALTVKLNMLYRNRADSGRQPWFIYLSLFIYVYDSCLFKRRYKTVYLTYDTVFKSVIFCFGHKICVDFWQMLGLFEQYYFVQTWWKPAHSICVSVHFPWICCTDDSAVYFCRMSMVCCHFLIKIFNFAQFSCCLDILFKSGMSSLLPSPSRRGIVCVKCIM